MSTICYELEPKTRNMLMAMFPPQYPKIYADHITLKMGGINSTTPARPEKVEVIGRADDGNGLEALIVKVNDELKRPDGKIFHITWSLRPDKMASADLDIMAKPGKAKEKPYKPMHSNGLVSQLIDEYGNIKNSPNPKWKITLFEQPIPIETKPMVQYDAQELAAIKNGKEINR